MSDIVDVETYEAELPPDDRDGNLLEGYREFRDAEGIPVHDGVAIDDVNAVETGPWDRTGQRGALINLFGQQGANDLQVHELDPAGETTVQDHLYEEIVYVSQGHGATTIRTPDGETTFEWSPGSLFFVPPNTSYRYVNLSDAEPARLFAQTPLPQLTNLFESTNFLFESDYDFWTDPDSGVEEYYTEGQLLRGDRNVFWETYFVEDVRTFDKLEEKPVRGIGSNVHLSFPGARQKAHISEFPPGTHNMGHRHQPGAIIFILSGEGYSLLWREDMDRKVKVPWDAGSIAVPPAYWYHQHFSTGSEPARYLALRAARLGSLGNTIFDATAPEHNIEYTDQDPVVRDHFEAELASKGLESQVPEEVYTDPDSGYGY